jgi:hypothetical protein
MLKQDNKCYYFEEINFNTSLFNEAVDATYILYLEGNGRYDSIRSQLSLYKPTKIVYIVHNKGYKKCPKEYVNHASRDCANSHIEAYIHAQNMSYNNVLILEDDFEFNPEIKKKSCITYINNFLLAKSNTNFIYYLGCMPFLVLAYDLYSYKTTVSTGTHSYITSKKYRELILINKKEFIEANMEEYINRKSNAYMYYKPLCYQLMPETDTQKSWGGNKSEKQIILVAKKYIKLVKLDKQSEPGYSIMYFFSKILFFIIIIMIICIIMCIGKYIMKIRS